MLIANKIGDKPSPCLKPSIHANQSECISLFFIQDLTFLYISMTIFNIFLVMPYSFNHEHNVFLQTESNAVEKSINAQHSIVYVC